MNNLIKKGICFAIALITTFNLILPVYACTGVIVGSDISEDGNYIFGRTEDLEVNHGKNYVIHEAGEYKADTMIKDVTYDETAGYEFIFPHDSYKFTSISDSIDDFGIFDEAGFNEKGLMADMTVSASANDEILAIDPYVDGETSETIGITEGIITTVVLSTADNAISAVKLIADEVATKGAAEGNGLVVADYSELWYMEIYSGHEFVAMKYPKDKFSVFPNTFWINEVTLEEGEVSDNYIISKDGNFIYSKGIFETAKKADTFVGNEDTNTIDLAKTYGPKELRESNRSRVCSGILHLNPDADVSLDSDVYHFLQDTTNKISLEDVLTFTQNRMENLNVVADDFSKDNLYPIGNRNTMEAHVFQLNGSNNPEYPGVMWLAIGSPLVSPFVAYYPNQTKAADAATIADYMYNDKSVYWVAMDILHMVEANRDEFMTIVKKHLDPLQAELIANTTITPLTSEEADAANIKDATLAFDTLVTIQKELKALYEDYLLNNDYTSELTTRKSTAEFVVSKINVTKGTADTKLSLAINPENNVIYIVDPYKTKVESVNNPITYLINTSLFESEVEFYSGDTKLDVTVNDEYYEFTTDSTEITYKEITADSTADETTETTTKNNGGVMIGVFAGLAVVLVLFLKNRKK